MSEVKPGQKVAVHYVGTLDDGTEFDSSRGRNTPLEFQVGAGTMIAGFDAAVHGMTIGETKSVRLAPEEAYGPVSEELVQNIAKTLFPPDFEFIVGATVRGTTPEGQPLLAKIESASAEDDFVVLNFNHPMAGQYLNFEIELLTAE